MRRLIAVLSLTIAVSALGQGRVDARAVDRLMTETMRAWRIPGAAIAIVKDDRVVYVNGYGTKELGGTEPVTADTLFQIASTTKAFTSTALAMLATEGKLSFDDPVRAHLDYFHLGDLCADSQVRIRDIVSHRTGLARHDELWDNSPWSREKVVRRIGKVELSKPFRTTYQYQNIMFIAAGEVVTHTAGMPWDDFVRTRIFKPLGMSHTALTDQEWSAADHAVGHSYDSKSGNISRQRPIDTTTIGAGGAIKSSARDMANWIRFQLAGGAFNGQQLVDPQLLAETKTPQTVIRMEGLTREANPESNLIAYGMGWVIQDYRGELLVSHAGALNGFRTHVDLLPERRIGLVLMINVGRGLALVALRNSLADLLTGKPQRDWNPYYLMIDRKADEKDAREKEERLAKRQPNTTPTLPLEAYAGEYEDPAYGTARITLVGDRLFIQWSRMTIPLTHFHYDVFTAESKPDNVDETVTFSLSPDHRVEALSFFGERFSRRPPGQ